MKLVIGIGNPGNLYTDTRHNIGFRVLDRFCLLNKLEFQPAKGDYWIVESELNAFHFFLVKPATYVNRSGLAVKEIIDKYNIEIKDLLIVCDDTNLPVGSIRLRKSGSDGGHNGLKSIIYHLETDNFMRLRIGVGVPQADTNLADYVLEKFPNKDLEIIENNYELVLSLIDSFITGGTEEMLNLYSKKSNSNSQELNNLNRK